MESRSSICLLLVVAVESSAELKEFKFQTAADGEVAYMFDTTAKLPLPVSDSRATVTGAALTLLLKTGAPQWTWQYALTFKTDVKVSSVTIEDESAKQLELLLKDESPQVVNKAWTGSEVARPFTPEVFDKFAASKAWIVQRGIIVTYEDGVQSKLHQLVIQSQAMRAELIDNAIAAMKAAK